MKRGWRGQATGIELILGGLSLLNACEWQSAGPNAEQIAMNNRGVAQMGHFDYAAAQQTFAALIEKYPGWTDARVNLAIAVLNRQQEGDEAAALAIVDQVLADEPDQIGGLVHEVDVGFTGHPAHAWAPCRRADPTRTDAGCPDGNGHAHVASKGEHSSSPGNLARRYR